jgi:ABC-type phosphate/phosphonate transport system substrate-binding protein
MNRARLIGIALAALALAGCGGGGETPATDTVPPMTKLRIGFTDIGTGDCAASAPGFSAELTRYLHHLAERLEIPVEACPVADRAEGARRLADKSIDMALLDPASYAPVAASVRPFLTKRIGTLGRTEAVVVIAEASPMRALAEIAGKRLVFAGTIPVMWDDPKQALRDAGVSDSALMTAVAAANPDAATAALRGGKADAMVLHSAAFTRLCRGASKSDRPCKGLRELWRGRAIAPEAWAMRRDMPPETWVRLVGIHVGLFGDAPAIAAWLAPGETEIEPIEATGLGASPTA